MVVDLAVDSQNDAVVRIGQGLGTAVCSFVTSHVSVVTIVGELTNAHNAQTFMAQDCRKTSARLAQELYMIFLWLIHTRVVANVASTCKVKEVSLLNFLRKCSRDRCLTPVGSPVTNSTFSKVN